MDGWKPDWSKISITLQPSSPEDLHDGVTHAVPVVPCLQGGAPTRPRHQGAAPQPPQGGGAVQEAFTLLSVDWEVEKIGGGEVSPEERHYEGVSF